MIYEIENVRESSGYMSFDNLPGYYNHSNDRGSDPSCSHKDFKREVRSGLKNKVTHTCNYCGYRRYFLSYA